MVAALKKNPEIAIGNVIGSNIFKVFFELGAERDDLAPAHGRITNFDLLWLLGASDADVRGGKILQGAYDNPPGGCGHGHRLCHIYGTADSGPVAAIYGK